jgi:PAS domain S-box-containing protein
MTDNDNKISYWNEAAEKIFEFSKEEAVGRPVHRLIVPERLREDALERYQRFKDTGRGPLIGKTMEVTGLKKDGTEFPIEISLSAVKIKDKWNAIGILRDITERKQLEGQLRISYKMASLGRLTAGVFHEILNPLNIISSHVQLLLMEAEKGSRTEKDLKSIQEEIDRIGKIADGLLRFSRKGEPSSKKIEINDLLEKMISLIEPDMKLDNIRFVRKFDDRLLQISGNRDELRQVFLNLTTNARDAMPEGGTLIVKTRSVRPPADRAGNRQAGKRKGDFVEITFEDTGCGIAEENIDKIFEPFFTTKEEGKGTGLGLSTSYGIIRNHGGEMQVESKEGKGTTFIIDLPC